jgi:hypothetical protein
MSRSKLSKIRENLGRGRTSNEDSLSWSLGARRSKKSSDHTTMACTREE